MAGLIEEVADVGRRELRARSTSVAQNAESDHAVGRQRGHERDGARSIDSRRGADRRARRTTSRSASTRDAEEGGQAIDRSIEGLTRVRESMAQSADVVQRSREARRATSRRSSTRSTSSPNARTCCRSTRRSKRRAPAKQAAASPSSPRRFAISPTARRRRRPTSPAIIKALQSVVQEAVESSTEGQRVAEESGRLAADGAAGLKRILAGIAQSSTKVEQIARGERRAARGRPERRAGRRRRSRRSRSRSRPATAEQATALQGLVRTTGQMRVVAQQVNQAMSDQGQSSREIIKAGEQRAASRRRCVAR